MGKEQIIEQKKQGRKKTGGTLKKITNNRKK